MIVSRTKDSHWVEGEHSDAVWSCDAPSIPAAQMRYTRLGGETLDNKWPEIENGLYMTPNEFVPIGRIVARAYGTRFYVGKPCKHHENNNIRMTSTKQCTVCRVLEQKGCK